jgi:hypothetical protein
VGAAVRWAVLERFGLIQVGLVSEQNHIAFIAPRRYATTEDAESTVSRLNAISPEGATSVPVS